MKLKTKVLLKKIYAFGMKIAVAVLRLRPIRNLSAFFIGKTASPESFLSSFPLLCQIETVDEMIKITETLRRRFPRNRSIEDRLSGLLLENNEVDRAYELAKASCEDQLAEFSERLGGDYEEKIASADLGTFVQIAGYFYSGSGAVLDHLKGYAQTVKWTPHGEVHVVKFPGGLWELDKNLEENGRLTKKDLVRFYLHVKAAFYVGSGAATYKREGVVNRFGQKILRDPSASFYICELLRLWSRLDAFATAGEQEPAAYASIVQTGLARAFNAVLYQNRAKILVCDQMVTAWRLPSAKLLPPSRFIIVHRDPRDQFLEAGLVKEGPGRKKKNAAQYAKQYRKRRELVDRWIPTLEAEKGHRFLKVAFEDFVIRHEDSVNAIRSFLALDEKDFDRGKTRFDPGVSIRNIGKYKGALDPRDVAHLEETLSEYLYTAD